MSKKPRSFADLSALSDLAPELADMLVAVAYDIALVLDEGGVIRSVALGETQAVSESACEWVGQRWSDTVTGNTREKVEAVLDDLANTGVSRLRQVEHASEGLDIPIAYAAVRLGDQGPTLAVGRDMRAVAAMQERLLQSQKDMERDHWRHRQAETRYRLLFQVSSDPTLIFDAASLGVLDANAAAARMLGQSALQIAGRSTADLFGPDAQRALTAGLEAARSTDRVAEGVLRLGDDQAEIGFSVTPFDNEAMPVLVVMFPSASIAPRADTARDAISVGAEADTIFADLIRRTPDAVVVCSGAGRIEFVNQALLDLLQCPPGRHIVGGNLEDWIFVDPAGSKEASIGLILARVRREGSLGLQAGRLRRASADRVDVEFSATVVGQAGLVGFLIRVSHHSTMQHHGDDERPDRNIH